MDNHDDDFGYSDEFDDDDKSDVWVSTELDPLKRAAQLGKFAGAFNVDDSVKERGLEPLRLALATFGRAAIMIVLVEQGAREIGGAPLNDEQTKIFASAYAEGAIERLETLLAQSKGAEA